MTTNSPAPASTHPLEDLVARLTWPRRSGPFLEIVFCILLTAIGGLGLLLAPALYAYHLARVARLRRNLQKHPMLRDLLLLPGSGDALRSAVQRQLARAAFLPFFVLALLFLLVIVLVLSRFGHHTPRSDVALMFLLVGFTGWFWGAIRVGQLLVLAHLAGGAAWRIPLLLVAVWFLLNGALAAFPALFPTLLRGAGEAYYNSILLPAAQFLWLFLVEQTQSRCSTPMLHRLEERLGDTQPPRTT